MSEIMVRPIMPGDNAALARIIRNALEEYGANHPGTVYFDESTDHLSDVFTTERSAYFVALKADKVLGGAGVFPTNGLPPDTCELVKMYLAPAARGKGIGKLLMRRCLQAAANGGFARVYLETMPELTDAIPMYHKFGFVNLPGPMGNTGHHGCHVWMMKEL